MISTATKESTREEVISLLSPSLREWFSKFKEITLPQKFGVRLIHEGNNTLISAPTGSGKTLTAFLSILNEIVILAEAGKLEDRIYCIYVSPLRALASDIEKNLSGPLSEMEDAYEEKTGKTHGIRVAMRSGDSTPAERARMFNHPPHILITTPESLAIILSSPKFIENFKSVNWVIIDEIHELASGKRGTHLSLSLERLCEMNKKPIQRIGLSATIAPLEDIAQFLVGFENGKTRECIIVNAQYAKEMKLNLVSPVEDLISTTQDEIQKRTYKILDDLIQAHHTTLIFTNTRSGTERLVHHLKQYFPKNYLDRIEAHHSSLSREERREVEGKLKRGEL
ncbi:MAG: DEAD/DEAH box helicase, partial [Candidatus Micrarchaeota archaeon]